LRGPKILIADDDRSVRAALTKRLSAWGYRVLAVCDGLGVIAQVAREPVVAMILDHGMPNGQGQDVAYMIRRESDAPIIFLSGYGRETFQQIAWALPDVFYLSKPVCIIHLQSLLLDLLGPCNIDRACA